MTPTYFTPEIKDFHFGFEFEYRLPVDDSRWHVYNWSNKSAIIEIKQNAIVIGGFVLKKENLRAKQLDEKDMNDLDFKLVTSLVNGKGADYKHNKLPVSVWIEEFVHVYIGMSLRFSGTIKHKSDLIKVLNLLNIKY